MANPYPTSWRKDAAHARRLARGFQSAPAAPAPTRPETPPYKIKRTLVPIPRPANDNWRRASFFKRLGLWHLPGRILRSTPYRLFTAIRDMQRLYNFFHPGAYAVGLSTDGYYVEKSCNSLPETNFGPDQQGTYCWTDAYFDPNYQPIENTDRFTTLSFKRYVFGQPRFDVVNHYKKIGATAPAPSFGAGSVVPIPYAPTLPEIYPHVDPFVAPNKRWSTAPVRAIPYPLLPSRPLNPDRVPGERTERGYGTSPSIPRPANSFELWPDLGANPLPAHARKAPPAGTREGKFIALPRAATTVARVISAVGEATEYVSAIHDALPKHLQTRSRKPQDQALAIWRHWEQIDVVKLQQNLFNEVVEDLMFGLVGQHSGKSAKLTNSPVGLLTGPWDTAPTKLLDFGGAKDAPTERVWR